MPVEIAKIDATAAFTGIQLTIARAPWIAAPFDARILHALEDRVEFIVADIEGIMVHVERIGIVEVQRQLIIDPYRSKVPHRPLIAESEYLREKFRRCFFVLCRHNRVIQLDRHNPSPVCNIRDETKCLTKNLAPSDRFGKNVISCRSFSETRSARSVS